ncbi:MAG: hypothetical protein SFZ23_04855 [Planctomycetota bacterium]|nr:hypothetical protein [Planctomycetota bacterium]
MSVLGQASPTQIVAVVGGLIVLVVVGGLAILAVRRRLFRAAASDTQPLLLDHLREMRRTGQMSEEEYQAAKRAIALKARDAMTSGSSPASVANASGRLSDHDSRRQRELNELRARRAAHQGGQGLHEGSAHAGSPPGSGLSPASEGPGGEQPGQQHAQHPSKPSQRPAP